TASPSRHWILGSAPEKVAKLRRADLGWCVNLVYDCPLRGADMLPACKCGLAVLCCLVPATAFAGPPYRTDDPEPTPLGHYEFCTFSAATKGQYAAAGD